MTYRSITNPDPWMTPNAAIVIPIRLAARVITTIPRWFHVNRLRVNRAWSVVARRWSSESAAQEQPAQKAARNAGGHLAIFRASTWRGQ